MKKGGYMKIACLVFMLFSTLAFAGATLEKGPYLQYMTDNSVFVCFRTDKEVIGTVNYGIDNPFEMTISDVFPTKKHEIKLTGLQKSTRYFYRIAFEGYTSEIIEFHTPVLKGEPFTFVAYGDSRSDGITHEEICNGIEIEYPDLILHTGDLVRSDEDQNDWDNNFFKATKDVAKYAPIYPTLGNHEYKKDILGFSKVHPENYHDYFVLPGNEKYYSFEYGNTFFLCIDSNYGDNPFGPGSAQYRWIENTLKEATDGVNDPTFIVAFFHNPPYTSGSHAPDYWVGLFLVPLFEQYRVDVVFTGHNHNYERSFKDPVVYIVTGGGGASLYDGDYWLPNIYKQYFEKTYNYTVWEVTSNTMKMKAKRKDGTVIDQVVINAKDRSDIKPTIRKTDFVAQTKPEIKKSVENIPYEGILCSVKLMGSPNISAGDKRILKIELNNYLSEKSLELLFSIRLPWETTIFYPNLISDTEIWLPVDLPPNFNREIILHFPCELPSGEYIAQVYYREKGEMVSRLLAEQKFQFISNENLEWDDEMLRMAIQETLDAVIY